MESQNFYRDLLDNVSDGVYFVDRDRRITYWNKAAAALSGREAGEVMGSKCSDNILVHIDDSGTQLCVDGCPLAAVISDGMPHEAHVYLLHKMGHRIPVWIKAMPILSDSGEIIGGVETFSDESAYLSLKARVQDLEYLSLIDGLTGIGNRRFADITLNARFTDFQRYGWSFGIIICDIDDFKKINDVYGHNIGDEILKMVAKTITGAIREPETALFRWGGEEFVVVISNVDGPALYSVAERIRNTVATSAFPHEKATLGVTISSGATMVVPEDSPDTIIRRGDNLLYQAKRNGKNCTVLQ